MLGALGVLDAGAIGAVWGIVAEFIRSRHERAMAREERKAARDKVDTESISHHLSGFRDSWHFNWGVLLLIATFCVILIGYSTRPDIEIVTFYPDQGTRKISLPILGTIYEWASTSTHTVTTGGVTYDMLRAMVALFFRIFTGVVARR